VKRDWTSHSPASIGRNQGLSQVELLTQPPLSPQRSLISRRWQPIRQRIEDVFRMADDSLGTLIGSVVFTQGPGGTQNPTFWLEPDERRVGTSDREWPILS
jgi:hypothetical protein